jgi:hypothetical protein
MLFGRNLVLHQKACKCCRAGVGILLGPQFSQISNSLIRANILSRFDLVGFIGGELLGHRLDVVHHLAMIIALSSAKDTLCPACRSCS